MHRIVAETSDEVSVGDAMTFRVETISADPADRGKGPLDVLLVEPFDPAAPTR